jgi:hypothetical protein
LASTLRTHSLSRRSSPKILIASSLGLRFFEGFVVAAVVLLLPGHTFYIFKSQLFSALK